ncbi:hypothetical protein SAMN05421773_106174 [Streptomyces aidingensis]|uniref:CdiI C-terminal domain-containing protein n=1 Tax=Streptomyces aidingensis TaxID=910347 RepID=A0A1I1MIK5_9ACTN|nr:hypothetical protein SAMN05421773_106174 [Streptomyces aidingensis]
MSKSEVFSIELDAETLFRDPDSEGPEAVGTIRIGEFTEAFRASLAYWSADDYRRSWRLAYHRLESADDAISCLITSITDPATSNFVFCWPLYREGEQVFVQNSVIFLDELTEAFDPEAPWASVGPRETITEDGDEISEWHTSMDALRAFFRRPAVR